MYRNLITAALIANILSIEKELILNSPQQIIKSEEAIQYSFSRIELETIILEIEDEYHLNLIDLNRDRVSNLNDLFYILNQSEEVTP
ncbi:hypothetical protein [Sediminitomix flava]|uniref:Uncharacterized protein n=1 Tax=Sediminitomix flava TaxID=379075 RepID=A0A315Z6B0_SEDFL|nr:hypothetical protein [Sediminitomix flava]PWJ38626.1 hypothetical protein BC781_107216 [Sediminitomix flava]